MKVEGIPSLSAGCQIRGRPIPHCTRGTSSEIVVLCVSVYFVKDDMRNEESPCSLCEHRMTQGHMRKGSNIRGGEQTVQRFMPC